MARIERYERVNKERHKLHETVTAGWDAFEIDGKTYFQIDTYGTKHRKEKGTISQAIQLDKEGATQLVDLLRSTFSL